MNSLGHSARELCLLALVTGLQLFLSSPGECLSLEIKGQSAFTVLEGANSEIDFFIYNMSREEAITLFVSKDGLHYKMDSSCKFILNPTTCSKFSGPCQCSTRPSEGRLQFVFKRKFQAQDAGEWKFDVWNTNIEQTVNISVKAVEVTTNTPLPSHAPMTAKPTSPKGVGEKTTKARAVTVALQTAKSTQTSTITSTFIPSHHFINNNSEDVGVAHEPQRTGLESYIVVIIVLLIVVAGVVLALGFVVWRHLGYIHRLRHYLVSLRHTHICCTWIDRLSNHVTSAVEANTYDRPNRASEGLRYSVLTRFFRRSRPVSRNNTYESYICTDEDGYLMTAFNSKDKLSSCDEEPPLEDYPRASNIYEIPVQGGTNIKQLH
ncbi:uncharacterized protein LOC112569225 isoform X2 [Pomacea canaliculata]|uniref:uncharacterized protein LOC112569225 isoform X2 n=1 Tax=Pomacea canaliculata TaxID=400727 RepID=UPI000D72BE66|nr:uncharacterized protein LOC112569225 isoform X2 [Pomacea canaliculata]